MILKVFSTALLWGIVCTSLMGQHILKAVVQNEKGEPLEGIEVYNERTGDLTRTNAAGGFSFFVAAQGTYDLVFFGYEYQVVSQKLETGSIDPSIITMPALTRDLSEVVIREQKEKTYALKRLNDVEGLAIYAGKKSEVVLIENVVGNKAANNARQMFGRVVGLNIYDGGDAGLQLNIGGRGLDPNRTSNFNTRKMDTISVQTYWDIRRVIIHHRPRHCGRYRW